MLSPLLIAYSHHCSRPADLGPFLVYFSSPGKGFSLLGSSFSSRRVERDQLLKAATAQLVEVREQYQEAEEEFTRPLLAQPGGGPHTGQHPENLSGVGGGGKSCTNDSWKNLKKEIITSRTKNDPHFLLNFLFMGVRGVVPGGRGPSLSACRFGRSIGGMIEETFEGKGPQKRFRGRLGGGRAPSDTGRGLPF